MWRLFLSFGRREYRLQVVSCIVNPIYQQITEMNMIMLYAPQLFSSFDSGDDNPLVSTIIIGAVKIVATLVMVLTGDCTNTSPLLLSITFLPLNTSFNSRTLVVDSNSLSIVAIDRFGRRPFLLEAGFQMVIEEIVIGDIGFHGGNLSPTLAIVVIVLIYTFISAFAWSWDKHFIA